jgi:hypothetical protein
MQLSKESKEAPSGKLPSNNNWDLLWWRPNSTPLHMVTYLSNSQQQPGNLCHNDANAAALSKLISNDSVQKVAGFASSKPHSFIAVTILIKYKLGAFATWMPKLHGYYVDHLDALLQHDCKLQ